MVQTDVPPRPETFARREASSRPKIQRAGPLSAHFKGLAAQLFMPAADSPSPQAIGITSCGHGEGVSSVAVNLAMCAAGLARSVVLVQVQMSRPAEISLQCSATPGLREFVTGSATIVECIHGVADGAFAVIPAGEAIGDDDLFASAETVTALLEGLRSEYDCIILDLPCLSENGSCLQWARQLDGIVLVIASEQLPRSEAVARLSQLEKVGAKVLGAVINQSRRYLPSWLDRRL